MKIAARLGGYFCVARHVEFRGERGGKIVHFMGKMLPKKEKYFLKRDKKSSEIG